MNYEQNRDKFGKWDKYFKNFIEFPDMDELFGYIKKRASTGVKILPDSSNVFRCFRDTDPDKLKVIICGISPYHTTYEVDKQKISIADGLAFSCSSTWMKKDLQPSIEQIYTSWENDYSGIMTADMIQTGDLKYLAEQGVLLYNIALTVEEGKALSMNTAWEKFNEYFWTQVINQWFRGIPCLFMGLQSHKSANLLTPMLHYPICVSHPASASYQSGQWSSEGCWKKVDKILWDNNRQVMRWWLTKNLQDDKDLPEWVTEKTVHTKEPMKGEEATDLPWQ